MPCFYFILVKMPAEGSDVVRYSHSALGSSGGMVTAVTSLIQGVKVLSGRY